MFVSFFSSSSSCLMFARVSCLVVVLLFLLVEGLCVVIDRSIDRSIDTTSKNHVTVTARRRAQWSLEVQKESCGVRSLLWLANRRFPTNAGLAIYNIRKKYT